MDGPMLALRAARGPRQAAQRTGFVFRLFRPPAPGIAALDPSADQGTIQALVCAVGQDVARPAAFGECRFLLRADPACLRPGDYLVGSSGVPIFFVASLPPFGAGGAILCNEMVSFRRAGAPASPPGGAPYGAYAAVEQSLTAAYPVFAAASSGAGRGSGLPDFLNPPGKTLLAPILPPGTPVLREGDVAVTASGARLRLLSVEGSDQGWRIRTEEAHV